MSFLILVRPPQWHKTETAMLLKPLLNEHTHTHADSYRKSLFLFKSSEMMT